MTISSMTGFARASGQHSTGAWQWELKSVNGKALDVRLRLPQGMDQLDATVRQNIAQKMKRGNVQVNLSFAPKTSGETVRINEALLAQLMSAAETVRKQTGGPPLQAEYLLSLRGVIDVVEHPLSEAESASRDAALMAGFELAVMQLVDARNDEGRRLQSVLTEQLSRITDLTHAARECPARQPEAIRARLQEQVQRLLEQSSSFDADRLHQEAILVATRADIQEELDRLAAHLEAAHDLLKSREPVGRKFDFLAQEFNREANTLCSKAGDRTLSAIGLDLKTVIDQMREQVQNIE